MMVQARRMVEIPESVAARSGEEIRSHVRTQLERLVSTLKANGAKVRPGAE